MTRLLSVRMPWAALIMDGSKQIENRSWRTEYRGRIGIHASSALAKGPGVPTVSSQMDRDRGHVLGTVLLANVHEASPGLCGSLRCEQRGGLLPGDVLLEGARRVHHWALEAPRALTTPFHAKGRLTLWEADDRTEHLMRIDGQVLA